MLLELTNFLGGVSKANSTIQVAAGQPPPTVHVTGPATWWRDLDLEINADLMYLSCDASLPSAVNYTWSTESVYISDLPSATSPTLWIPKYTLGLGVIPITLSVLVVTPTGQTTLETTFTVTLVPSQPIALISVADLLDSAGSSGFPTLTTRVYPGQQFGLDATASTRPDCNENSYLVPSCSDAPVYTWDCCITTDPSGPNLGNCDPTQACPADILQALSKASSPLVPITMPSLNQSQSLTFSVVRHDGPQQSLPALVTVTPLVLPSLVIDIITAGLSPMDAELVASPSSEIGVTIVPVMGHYPYQFTWQILSPPSLSLQNASAFNSDPSKGILLQPVLPPVPVLIIAWCFLS